MTDKPDHKGRAFRPRTRPRVLDERIAPARGPLPVSETLAGKSLVVFGGTGFLGKVLLALLLGRFDGMGRIFLVVRPKTGLSPDERFFQEIWTSPCFEFLKEGKSEEEADAWVRERVTAIGGDISRARAGIDDETFAALREAKVAAVLNVAGVVSFTPPIDEAFEVNANGTLNLVQLCRDLGGLAESDDGAGAVPLLHTSTCYVAGYRIGEVPEEDPRLWPFPRCDEMGREHWDPNTELAQGLEIARHIRARADDGHLKARFERDARKKLRDRHLPTTGEPFEEAKERERSRWLENELVEAGTRRSQLWGWPNTYTYTKAVGEQLLMDSGVPACIVRPAIVESSLEFPFPGWNEGINTSAPLIYMALHGHVQFPTTDGHVLDVIPVDHVCYGLVLALAALLRGEHDAVVQLATSDTNGMTMNRLIELTGFAKRRHMRSRKRGNPLLNRLYARVEPINVAPERWQSVSSPGVKKALAQVQRGVKALRKTPAAPAVAPIDRAITGLTRQAKGAEMVMRAFLPFIAELDYRFRADRARALFERATDDDRARLPYLPHELDWRVYWREAHVPGLKKWVFPHLEARLFKRPRAHERFSDLLAFLDEVAEREGGRVALQQLERDGGEEGALRAVSYRDLRRRAHACAMRLADVGVHPGDRVAIVANNSPEWAIAFFGVLAAGGTVVPLDPEETPAQNGRRVERAGVEFVLIDERTEPPDAGACLELDEFAADPGRGHAPTIPEVLVSPDDIALITFPEAADDDKPVVMTHRNVTAVLASVAPLFKLGRRDSGLSVLPLHQSFELCCGLLLPLLRGAHVTYVDELSADRLSDAFEEAGITAMIGVPQVWQDLERQINEQLAEAGPFAEAAFEAGVALNRTLGKALGINLGRVLFRPIHDRLGGRIRFMMSTGGHLPKKTADTFRSLGIELKQGYGMSERAPVVTLGDSRGRGEPVPGVEVEVRDVSEDGVGEIFTRGDAVMLGTLDDDDEAAPRLEPDGWLRTGDLARIDKEGRITVVAYGNEVITVRGGLRVYPREIEERLGGLKHIAEAAVVGIPDGQGGERVAALVIAKRPPADGDGEQRLQEVQRRAERECRQLEEHERPSAVLASFEPLPRAADRAVKRPAVIARVVAAQAKPQRVARPALAPDEVLGEAAFTPPRERERLPAPGRHKKRTRKDPDTVHVPEGLARVARRALGKGQMAFYDRAMNVKVAGEQHIPQNRQTIVASNHASHLDMGLIKYALGPYGQDIVALAAKDYFFEGKWRRGYFENFTNLRPLDRADNPREAMREASSLLESGRTILLFPEGTRTASGEMADFRPAVAYLALKHGVDILPVYVEGTYRSMPRGAVVPKNRRLGVKVGPPLDAAWLKKATDDAGLRMSAACQKVAVLVQRAVEAARDDRVLDVARALDEVLGRAAPPGNGASAPAEAANPLVALFADLEGRFQADEVTQPVTYYFSLGQGPETKWMVQVTKSGCKIANEKPADADCVMKTDVAMFTRIVKENYIPQVSEFLDGTVKTNDPELLTTFVQVFNL